ncbi:MAG: DUF3732 domain-containing protein [Planctomycetaceae bacterium]|nr:DUF3732 domain-containing protein [Planctomycetaceae bacterium]
MKCYIGQIILYPKDQRHRPRVLHLEPTGVNVITGTSKRGKSAVGKIIDYCLASSVCQIPKGVIRTTVAWYGIGLQLAGRYVFIARREPGDQVASRDFCVLTSEGACSPLPQSLERTKSFEDVKELLNAEAGLAAIPLEAFKRAQESFGGAPGFRDLIAFNFLPQHIVANPQTLFYRTDDYVYFERLKKILPLAVGAVTQEGLLAELHYGELMREIRDLGEQIKARREAVDTWQEEGKTLYERALEAGLIPDNLAVDDADEDISYTSILSTAKQLYDEHKRPSPVGMAERFAKHLVHVRQGLERLEQRRQSLKRKLVRCTHWQETTKDYRQSLEVQLERLSVADQLRQLARGTTCPFCGSLTAVVQDALNNMATEAEALRSRVGDSDEVQTGRLLALTKDVHDELHNVESRIWKLTQHLSQLESRQSEVKMFQDAERVAARLIGQIEQLLATVDVGGAATSLEGRKTALETQAKDIREKYGIGRRTSRTKDVLARLSASISGFASQLGLEWSEENPTIDLNRLTLVFSSSGEGASRTLLSELGSGENWMGYHLATFLALHKAFGAKASMSHVPSFLIIDQPTQVYFPTQADAYDNRQALKLDNDVQKAKAIFRVLADSIACMDVPLQIIVTEHADKDTWGEYAVHEVANWREGKDDPALIPSSWMSEGVSI